MSDTSERLGFDPWQQAVVVAAALVSTLAVVWSDPLVGLAGLAIAVAGWAGTVKLLQFGNAALRERLGHRLPGVATTRLYGAAALLGLLGVVVQLRLQSPSGWRMLAGRFTPELAAYGVFVLGGLVALGLVLGRVVYARFTAPAR